MYIKQWILSALSAAVLTVSVMTPVSAEPSADQKVLSVAVNSAPARDILSFMRPQLAKQDVTLKLVPFDDAIQPNLAVASGDVMVNCTQDQSNLTFFNRQRQAGLQSVGQIYTSAMSAYARDTEDIKKLREHAIVAIPSDAVSGARALLLLQEAGLIKLKPAIDGNNTIRDVVDNPKQLIFRELRSSKLAQVLNEVDLAIFSNNYAVEAGLDPKDKALLSEQDPQKYATICATLPRNKDSKQVQALMRAWHSPETARYIQDQYHSAIAPLQTTTTQ